MKYAGFLLSTVQVQGYKGFQNNAEIQIDDLTLVYGENSAGKSSIMRLLVSIALAVGENSRYPLLPVSVDESDQNFSSLFTNGQSASLSLTLIFREPDTQDWIRLSYSIQHIREKNLALIIEFSIQRKDKKEWKFQVDTDYASGSNFERKYFAILDDEKIDADIRYTFSGIAPVVYYSNGCPDEIFSDLGSTIDAVYAILNNFSKSVVWIGPLRHIPARHSTLTCFPISFSANGRETLQLLHPANPYGADIVRDCSSWFQSSTSRLLSVNPSVESNTEVFSISLAPTEAPLLVIPIAEHGSGMAQVLPIVVLCAAASLGHPMWATPPLLIFENPELHLHDAVHEKLANLFLETAGKDKVRIIAETHSENVLLTTQIAELERPEKDKKKISVNWVRKGNDGYSEVDQFKFDENGSLGGLWSKSIFGYTPELARRVMMLKLNKRTLGGTSAN